MLATEVEVAASEPTLTLKLIPLQAVSTKDWVVPVFAVQVFVPENTILFK